MKPTLQPLEDFVLKRKLDLGIGGLTYENLALEVIKLAEFLKSTPLLKHFIECDENGEPMQKCDCKTECGYCKELEQFQQAQKQVLFEGCEIVKIEMSCIHSKKVVFNGLALFYYQKGFNKWKLNTEIQSYSDLTKHNITTNENFKQLIYGK